MTTPGQAAALSFGLLVGAALWPALARGDEATDAFAAVSQRYRALEEAIARKDVAAIFADHAPDFYAVEPDGTVLSLAQERQQFERALPTIGRMRAMVSIQRANLINGRVLVVRYQEQGEAEHGAPGVPGSTWTTTGEDTWSRADGTWRVVATHIVSRGGPDGAARTAQSGGMSAQDQLALMRAQQNAEALRSATAAMNCAHGIGYNCGRGNW